MLRCVGKVNTDVIRSMWIVWTVTSVRCQFCIDFCNIELHLRISLQLSHSILERDDEKSEEKFKKGRRKTQLVVICRLSLKLENFRFSMYKFEK